MQRPAFTAASCVAVFGDVSLLTAVKTTFRLWTVFCGVSVCPTDFLLVFVEFNFAKSLMQTANLSLQDTSIRLWFFLNRFNI